MTFLECIPETNSHLSTLDKSEMTPLAPKKSKASQESDTRAVLYIALEKSFDKPTAPQPNTSESKKGENSLEERANLFWKTVADNLLQCNTVTMIQSAIVATTNTTQDPHSPSPCDSSNSG